LGVDADRVGPCGECGASLKDGQRYCVECGNRVAGRSPLLEPLLRSSRSEASAESGPPAAAQAAPAKGLAALSLALPSPRISALLVLAFLGFGVLVGGAASPRVQDTLAASQRRPIRVVIPQTAATASATSPETPVSPPPSGAEATPEPSTGASTPAPAPASSTKPPATANSSPSTAPSEPGSTGSPSTGSASKLPPVKHVFLITLADEPYASVFGPASSASYLSQTLERRGELLVRYYAVAHEELPNGIALLSGQGPTTETAANCPTYTAISPGAVGAEQQVTGQGCVYPQTTQTLAGQLTAKHLSWRAYVEGMDEGGTASSPCSHPSLGQPDPSAAQPPPAAQSYATFRNPFVYFDSVIDSPQCATDDVGLNRLGSDLAKAAQVPSLSYIVPNRCHDGSPSPCAPGAAAGPPAADGFLQKVVPEILASKAYKNGGLLVITVDEAPSTGPFADSSSCCSEPQFPNLPAPPGGSIAGLPLKGGGEVGALLLSPYVKAGTTNQEQYNHFSLLRTIEDLYGLKHLGYAGLAGVSSFGASVFSAYGSG
jgi:phosphatidylinositol-3-phosphatase